VHDAVNVDIRMDPGGDVLGGHRLLRGHEIVMERQNVPVHLMGQVSVSGPPPTCSFPHIGYFSLPVFIMIPLPDTPANQ
jgi:hypothetical protein